jgi:hypothetical protein
MIDFEKYRVGKMDGERINIKHNAYPCDWEYQGRFNFMSVTDVLAHIAEHDQQCLHVK